MKYSKLVTLIFLMLIMLLGSFLRLKDLDKNPNGFYVDEAVTGYNAWSILQTGKDEYGKSFPLAFRFFGSYTPPLYTLLTSGIIWINGLSIFSTRFLSALSGVLIIPLTYLFVKSFKNSISSYVPLLGAFFIAISPWSIFYSRVGYEVHLAFFIYSLGVYLLLRGISKPFFVVCGLIFLALSMFTYHTQKLLVPITIFAFAILFRKELFNRSFKKYLVFGFAIFVIILTAQLYILLTPAGLSRVSDVTYTDKIINPVIFAQEFFSQYFSYFSPRNLFFEGDYDLQRSIPNMSIFFSWMIVLYLVGIYKLIKNIKEKTHQFILSLLLITPIPASLTSDPFATQRALPMLAPLIMVMVLGVDELLKKIKNLGIFLIITLSFISLGYFYRSFAVLLPSERAISWGYGFKQLADEIKKRPSEKFLIDTTRIKPAYIELAFYLKYPPEKFQQEIDQSIKNNYYTNTKWSDHYNFGQIETRNIDFKKDDCIEQILVGDEYTISKTQAGEHKFTKEFEIKSPINEIIFVGHKTHPEEKCN